MIKGRDVFTTSEYAKIKSLLVQCRNAVGKEQAPFRREIRSLGFYISDFDTSGKGFTQHDLQKLKESRSIRVIGD